MTARPAAPDGTTPEDATPEAVADLELLAARSWRGLEEERLGDWLLRAGGGFTGRANSVLAVGSPGLPHPQAVAAVARWYAERGLRPRAQVPLPGAEEADAALAAAGWERDEDVLVLTAATGGWPAPAVHVELADAPDEAWLAGYRYRGSALPPVARQVLLGADEPVFASVRPGRGPLAAVARGAVVGSWLVVTAVTVDEGSRRRGLATSVMAALGTWAADRGATSCVLQVVASNAPALALYQRLDFTEHHRYHYRLGAAPGPPVPAAGDGAAR